jgi:Tol biopolymer transport system component
VSPDGRHLAFIGSKDGESVLFVQALDSLSARPIAGTEGASSPFWSPDGRAIGFFAADKLMRVDLAGGMPVTLCDAPNPRGGSWGDDVIVFGMQGQPLHRVSPLGGIPAAVTTLRTGEMGHNRPFFLPGGRRYLFRAQTASAGQLDGLLYNRGAADWIRGPVFAGSLDTNEITSLVDSDSGNAQFAVGRLLFVRGNALLSQAFNPETLALSGEPVRVADGLAMNGNPPVAKFSAAAHTLIYLSGTARPGQSSLQWFDRSGRLLGPAAEPDLMAGVELSPDGRAVAVSRTDPATYTSDIWILEGTRRTRLTLGGESNLAPVWSPDGRSIAFRSNRTGTNEIYLQVADGSRDAEPLVQGPDPEKPTDWSRDGRFLLYELANAQTFDIVALRLQAPRTSVRVVDSIYDERGAKFSPDGRWVAYVSRESGADEVYARTFPGPGGQLQISTGGGVQPRWSRDGRELFYLEPSGMLMSVSLSTAAGGLVPGMPKPLFQTRMLGLANDTEYDVAPDGRFLVNAPVNEAGATPITVFLNWAPR